MTRKNKLPICVALVFSLMLSQIPTAFAAEKTTEEASSTHTTGYKSPTEEGRKWIKDNMIKTEGVKLNKLGLERVNRFRKNKKQKELKNYDIAKKGEEIIGSIDTTAIKASNPLSKSSVSVENTVDSTDVVESSILPNGVDNSELTAFPPIRNQYGIGSCVSFASTYYQMTYMTALDKGWNAKSETDFTTKLSPKWSYNFTNGGEDSGTSFDKVYKFLSKSGTALWSDFPYDGNNEVSKNYLEWPSASSIYKNAMNYKIDKMGYVNLYDGTETPIKSFKDDNLTNVKALINNGYVLVFATNVSSWKGEKVVDDTSTSNDDKLVGEKAYYMVDGSEGGHAMTIVGYNDDIWVDINGNSIVDSGEKGAFKIANSWGKDNDNQGFRWFCYDALNRVSAVSGAPTAINSRDFGWFENNGAFWINVKESYSPKLVAEFTINQSLRNQVSAYLGYSSSADSDPIIQWKPFALLDSNGGKYAFDGTKTAGDATVALDFTDIYSANFANTDGKWYLKLKDTKKDGKPTIIKNFKLIDNVRGIELNSTDEFPKSCDGGTILLSIDNQRSAPSLCQWTIEKTMPEQRYDFGSAVLDNKIFIFGGNYSKDNADYASKSVLVYDKLNDTWTSKGDMPVMLTHISATALNDKIYLLGTLDDGIDKYRVIYEYDPSNDKYTQKSVLSYNVALNKTATANDNVSGETPQKAIDDATLDNSKWCATNEGDKWLKVDLGEDYDITRWVVRHSAAGGEGSSSNTRDFSLQKSSNGIDWTDVDAVTGNVADVTDRNVDKFTTRYVRLNITKAEQNSNSAARIYEFEVYGSKSNTAITPVETTTANSVRGKASLIAANGKLYIMGGWNNNKVEEYDPASGIVSYKADIPVLVSGAAVSCVNDKIYAMGGSTNGPINNVYMLDPVSNEWTAKANMPEGKKNFRSEVINGKIYTFGNATWAGYNRTIGEYDPLSDIWTDKGIMLCELTDYNLIALNNEIYLLGGYFDKEVSNLFASFSADGVNSTITPTPTLTVTPTITPTVTPIVDANVALNKVATADSYVSGEEAEKAINGTTENNSKWCTTAEGDKWLAVDLGQNYNISRWVVKHAGAGGENSSWDTKEFKLQKSDDGTNWIDVDPVTANTLDITDRNVDMFVSRYVRLYITQAEQDSNVAARIYEFEIYGAEVSATPTVIPTVTPTTINTTTGNLLVEFYNSNTSNSTNTSSMNFKVTNMGSDPVDLSKVKIRYYYTIDGEIDQNFSCDWSNIGSSNVVGNYVKLSTPVENADYYLEIGFGTSSGTLSNGDYAQGNIRMSKSDWSNYNQTNDYSFNNTASSCVIWDKTPAYIGDSKVWGFEP